MPESPEQLLAGLAGWPGVNRYLVAFSGGLDSAVLLHAMACLAQGRRSLPVRAIHIHHGLHEDAAAWTAHCRAICQDLGVPFEVYFARISPGRGESPEAAARSARYNLLLHAMQPNDALLTAHHSDDQIETILMRLVRGAGVEGLAGIPPCRPFGPGRLLRPFLSHPRGALLEYADAHGLPFLVDPSNADERFDRNYLREEILPRLKARWPAAAASAQRSAGHLAAASRLMEQIGEQDLIAVGDRRGALRVSQLCRMPGERLRNLLRYWISRNGFRMPSTAKLEAVIREAIGAARDAGPCVEWEGAQIRRYRDCLYLMRPLPVLAGNWSCDWNLRRPLMLPVGLGKLVAVPCASGGLDARLAESSDISVRFRQGGERIRPAGHEHRKSLRNLYQELGIVPWMRARVPLIFFADRLTAVADLWLADEAVAASGAPGLSLRWDAHPPL